MADYDLHRVNSPELVPVKRHQTSERDPTLAGDGYRVIARRKTGFMSRPGEFETKKETREDSFPSYDDMDMYDLNH